MVLAASSVVLTGCVSVSSRPPAQAAPSGTRSSPALPGAAGARPSPVDAERGAGPSAATRSAGGVAGRLSAVGPHDGSAGAGARAAERDAAAAARRAASGLIAARPGGGRAGPAVRPPVAGAPDGPQGALPDRAALCRLGRRYGHWAADSPAARACGRVYGD